jgi:LmbE family N-acetylglucosaminyl deacetylase
VRTTGIRVAAVGLALGGIIAAAGMPATLQVAPGERLLVVAPHPDDETIGAGGLVQRVLARGGSVRIVVLTAGDGYVQAVARGAGRGGARPGDYLAYGERRLRESRAAVRALGGGRRVRLEVLGFPDGGLLPLLKAHWPRRRPERSPTTRRERPPYGEAVDRRVRYDGEDLERELAAVLRETRPTIVVFPDPADVHPDHRAAGLFTLLALRAAAPESPWPRLLAYLVHWPDWPPGWRDAALDPTTRDGLTPPANLPARGLGRTVLALEPAEVEVKAAAMTCYASQREVMGSLLAAFVRRTEPFTEFTAAQVARVGRLPDVRDGGVAARAIPIP